MKTDRVVAAIMWTVRRAFAAAISITVYAALMGLIPAAALGSLLGVGWLWVWALILGGMLAAAVVGAAVGIFWWAVREVGAR